jgi:hypothetical protein
MKKEEGKEEEGEEEKEEDETMFLIRSSHLCLRRNGYLTFRFTG